MSSQALQRVLVRMLYDPAFADRIYAEPKQALAGLSLSSAEKGWLLRPDRRAFSTDPYRRGRGLQGVLEEYPSTCALAVAAGIGWDELDAFFTSELFHDGIQRGRSLALTFGGHLFELAGTHADREPWLEPLARLERGLARVRRRISHTRGRDDVWALAPHVETLQTPRGTLATHQMVSGRLGDPAEITFERLLDPSALQGLQLPKPSEGREHLLLSLGDDDIVRIEALSPELFAILETARGGVTHEELAAVCQALGADESQIDGILDDFTQSGELVPPRRMRG